MMTKLDKKEEENFSEDTKSEDIKNDTQTEENLSEDTKSEDIKNDTQTEEKIEDKLKVVEEKLLRTLAEMENQRRRFEKERQEAFEFGGFNFAKESLSLLDNIDRATTSFKTDEKLKNNKDLNKIIEGIEVIKDDLVSIFKKNGVNAIKCIDQKFDPNFHQAMLEIEDSTNESGIVIQEIQKGYMMKERLLRPSLVGVTKKRDKNPDNTIKDSKKDEK